MTVGQTIEAKIVVDAKQAQAAVESFAKSTQAAETAIKRAGDAMPALERSTGTAASKMLILGQFVDDAQYGLRGVVNNMPQVVQAFGGTMGLAGAVGIAAVGLSQLYDAYKSVDAMQKEAASNAKIWQTALRETNEVQRQGALKSTQDLVKALQDAQAEIRNFGKTAAEVRLAQAGETVKATEQTLAILEKNLPGLEARAKPQGRRQLSFLQQIGVTDVFTEEEKEDFKMQNALVESAKRRRAELTDELKKQKAALTDLESATKQIAKLDESKKTRGGGGRAGKSDADRMREMEAQAEIDAWKSRTERDRAEREERKRDAEEQRRLALDIIGARERAEEDAERKRKKLAEEAAKERIRIAKEEAEAKAKAEHEFQSAVSEMTMNGVGIAVSATQQYIDARIKGEEAAEAAFAASIMAQAGQALISYGTQLGGKAIMDAFIAPPLAAAEGAAAAGLIAAGIGLGGAATAVQHTAGGGTVGKPMGDRSGATDRGAAPRTGGGGGSGGPLVVNVSYGVGGPLPEDTAREIAKVMKTGNRRRGAA